MDELTLDNKKYLSSKKAAQVTGYAKDYVGQLCREGRVDARLVGRNWYVLETSILEHRFGAEDADTTEKQVKSTPERTWEAPVYTAEPVEILPEIPAKPRMEASVEKNNLADMQAAWKEWFTEVKTLPDAAPMLLEDHEEPYPHVPEAIEDPIEASETPEEVHREDEQEMVPIRIERKIEPARATVEEIQQFRVNRSAGETVRRAPFVPQNTTPEGIQHVPVQKRGGSAIHALFFAIVVVALAVTVIGSGVVDNYIASNNATTAITNYLGGVKEISK